MASLQEMDEESLNTNSPSQNNTDLPDSIADEKVMEEDEITIDLPDVSDIPGQENIVPPKMGMFADTTIASNGEEGTDVFKDGDEDF